MKKFLKSLLMLAIVLAVCIILNPTETQAATVDDLTFTLNSDGASYSVEAKSTSISGSLTIPATFNGKPVTTIGDDAFCGYSDLTSVTIPNSVTTIGQHAFRECTKLTSITIPDSVTSIGYCAFYGCSKITNMTIGDGGISIAENAFFKCYSLLSVAVGDGGVIIGETAFSDCTSLRDVTIGDGRTTIGSHAFDHCDSLEQITIGNGGTTIRRNAFGWSEGLTSITIGDGNTVIEYGAFMDNDSLSYVTIGNGVITIGESAFMYCDSLTNVVIGDGSAASNDSGSSIGDYAFAYCRSLTSVMIPDSVTTIGNYAFQSCYALTSVTIPDSVTAIGDCAFQSCDVLTSVTIGNSVTTIGDCAFQSCSALTSVTIPDSVTAIGERAFNYCKSLTGITIPNNVTVIGDYAFFNCHKLTCVHYTGTEEEKGILSVNYTNAELIYANWHYAPQKAIINGVLAYFCSECSCYYSYDCKKAPLKELEVTTLPDRVRYFAGETVALEGIALAGTYSDGTRIILNARDVTGVSADLSAAGRKTVTVTVHGASATFEAIVHEMIENSPVSQSIVVNSSLYPQSAHQYTNNMRETKIFKYPGAVSLTITFNNSTYVQEDADYIYIYDGNGKQIARYTGSYASNQTLTIQGDTFQVKLLTNNAYTYYGYAFSSIVANLGAEKHSPIVDPATVTCTEAGFTEGSHCDICGEVLVAQEVVAALGHTEAIIPGKAATCVATGLTDGKKCTVCGEVLLAQTEIEHSSHTKVTISGKAPSCTDAGLTQGEKCGVCGVMLLAQQEIPALGGKHTYDSYFDNICNNCGAINPENGNYQFVNYRVNFSDPDTTHTNHRVVVYKLGDKTVTDPANESVLKAIDANAETYWGASHINKICITDAGNYVLLLKYNVGTAVVRVPLVIRVNAKPKMIIDKNNKITALDSNEANINHRVVVYYLGDQMVEDIYDVAALEAIDAEPETIWKIKYINRLALTKGGNYVLHLCYNEGVSAKLTVAQQFSVESIPSLSVDINNKVVVTEENAENKNHRAVVYYLGENLVEDPYDEAAVKAAAVTTSKTYWGLSDINKQELKVGGNYVIHLYYNVGTSDKRTLALDVTLNERPSLSVDFNNKIVVSYTDPEINNVRAYIYNVGKAEIADIYDEAVLKSIATPTQVWGLSSINKKTLTPGTYVVHFYYSVGTSSKKTVALKVTI